MAIYHLTAKTGTRAGGHSACAKADYIQREHRYERNATDVLYRESGHMPAWVTEPRAYWIAADTHERANGRLFKEIEFALPVELTADQQRELTHQFAQQLTAAERLPYTLAIHTGKRTNPHCHLLISERVNDGIERTPAQWFRRYNRQEPAHGGSRKTEALKPQQWLEQTRQTWAELTNRALERAGVEARIDHRRLERQGIERLPQIHLGPTVSVMEQRGLRTDRGDHALQIERLNRQILELTSSETLTYERDRALTPSPERGRTGRRDRTPGPELSPASGRRPRGLERDLEPSERPGRHLEPAPEPDGRALAADRPDRGAGCSAAGERNSTGPLVGRGSESTAVDRGGDHGLDRRGGSAERIRALAEPLQRHCPGRPELAKLRADLSAAPARQAESHRPSNGMEPALDRSYLAARRQLQAMDTDRFDIGIRDGKSGQMLIRTWSAEETLKAVPWLKRENAKGADIYIRPAGEQNQGVILLDDLTRGAVERLKRDQLTPAAVIETSPDNFQAWIRLSQRPLAPVVATAAAKRLAQEYGSDPNSADWRHFGRLAGFTNRKPIHQDERGRSPYVLAHECSGQAAEQGPPRVQQAHEQVRQAELHHAQKTRLEAARTASERVYRHDPLGEYQRQLKRLLAHYGPSADLSRIDWMICKDMVLKGYNAQDLSQALSQASPELPARKLGHEQDYVERTIDRVMALPEVRQKQRELEHEQDRSLSP